MDRYRDGRGRIAGLIQVAAQQLVQGNAAGRLLQAAEDPQAQLPGKVGNAVEHPTLGTAEDDQCRGKPAVGQVTDQFQAVLAVHVQVADGDIDPPTPGQGLPGPLDRLSRQHIEDAIGVEHLMQGHQLERMILENQNLQ
ncbi:hypothetical protein D3C79_693050 [compost metagenome]